MAANDKRIKYALPRPENVLAIIQRNILQNLKNGNGAKVQMLPLLQRAYILVNETGVIPYKDYAADVEFLEEQ
jgi:hypothetical protein